MEKQEQEKGRGLLSRRYFLEVLGASAIGVAAVGSIVLTGTYLSPNVVKEPPTRFKAGSPENYSPGSVTLEGWGIAGPNQADQAIARALETSGSIDGVFTAMPNPREALALDHARLPLGLVDVEAIVGGAEAAVSAFAFVLAVARLRRGGARRLLVVSGSDSLACAAVVAGGPNGQ